MTQSHDPEEFRTICSRVRRKLVDLRETQGSASQLESQKTDWPPSSFLNLATPAIREQLLQTGIRRRFKSGEVLASEGELTDEVLLLRSGWVKVGLVTDDGVEALLAIRARGDIVGELSAIGEVPRSATVTACSTVVAQVLPGAHFKALLQSRPDVWMMVARTLADQLRTANRRRLEFAGYSARVRLARILVELGRSYGIRTAQGETIALELTQSDLAAAIGAAEVTVQKALRELRDAGLIATSRRRITILRPNELKLAARSM
jgi:CRP/FNR family transcriptional regulator, cyclic AMP receptor protein